MKKVVIAVAPFGFGPAAKAIRIIEGLRGLAQFTVVSKGSALRFIEANVASGAVCLDGSFADVFTQHGLDSHDLYLSINNEPAIRVLLACGLQAQTIFIDSLLGWRLRYAPPNWDRPIRYWLAEDFPDMGVLETTDLASEFIKIAPLIYSRQDLNVQTGSPGRLTLSMGGMTSPLVGWESIVESVSDMASTIIRDAHKYGLEVSLTGSKHLAGLVESDQGPVDLMTETSPSRSFETVAASHYLIATPGLGSINEALVLDVPLILLPPMNSTQLYNLGVCVNRGIPTVLSRPLLASVLDIATMRPWERQTHACLQWLSSHRDALLRAIHHRIGIVLSSSETLRPKIIRRQQRLLRGLSSRDGISILRRMLMVDKPDESISAQAEQD